jgi:hypothetical protein
VVPGGLLGGSAGEARGGGAGIQGACRSREAGAGGRAADVALNNTQPSRITDSLVQQQRYGVLEGELLELTLRTITGISHSCALPAYSNVVQLKQLVQEQQGIRLAEQRLIHNDQELTDSKGLVASGVKTGDTLFLVLKLADPVIVH